MEDVQIILSALWVSLMLTYLLGDVIRIFSGDFVAGEMDGQKATQAMWMGAAVDGSCFIYADSNRYVVLDPSSTNAIDWLVKHNPLDIPFPFQSRRAALISGTLRQVSNRSWTCVEHCNCLVCMELDLPR
jgi:hypothetical protein